MSEAKRVAFERSLQNWLSSGDQECDSWVATIGASNPIEHATSRVEGSGWQGYEPAERVLWRAALSSQIDPLFGQLIHVCNETRSPIERWLLLAMVSTCSANDLTSLIVHSSKTRIFGVHPAPYSIHLTPQAKIANYTVDFLVEWHIDHDRISEAVVECDGHDFHERTKEQARSDKSRDRAIQSLGLHVLRFTGSEIFADPIKCAREILLFGISKESK